MFQVESAVNTLPEKVESTPKEVEAQVAAPPAAEPVVVEAATEETHIEAPTVVEDLPTVETEALLEIVTEVVEPPKSDIGTETTQEEMKADEEKTPAITVAVPEETVAATEAVPEETVAAPEAVPEETLAAEEAKETVSEDTVPAEVIATTPVATEE